MRVGVAGGGNLRLGTVWLQLQLLDSNHLLFGQSWVERCVIFQGAHVTLLSGMGLRSRYWAGTSPGWNSHLGISTSRTGLNRVLR